MGRGADIRRSWDKNAENWIRAVREGLIPSRTAGTDEAILDAIARRRPARLLDVGCGEGWLVRRAAASIGCEAVGTDASAKLIAAARAADPKNRYEVASYTDLIAGADGIGGGFDVIACNYALFEADAAPLLNAVRRRLSKGGAIAIQTLHPDSIAQAGNGWRIEDFSAFESGGFESVAWAPMPWYHRSLESWRGVVRDAGLIVKETIEPAAGAGQPPLSLLLVCVPS